ncbi:Festuclavine synthase II [Colletotrichum spinosum]|uniref:Festuclavine synthase II n=1 Tax=Colletotrichum spinosum TaxID=1347390 RepID=A0A4R8Q197_9PEZI|nr:Festuclavine synthase II [Colletotrichum spinosum]
MSPNSNPQKVLIIGGTGKVGRHLTKLFASTDIPAYQSSRAGASTTEPNADNIKPIAFDWFDDKTWIPVFDLGITAVYIVGPQAADMLTPTRSFIDQARLKGTKRFVLQSGSPWEANINGDGAGRPHAYLKQLGDRGEVEWAVLRPTWFQQNFAEQPNHLNSIVDESLIYSATADGRVPWVSTMDIAACAFQLLLQDDAPNDQYLILGPELLTYADIANALTEVTGRKIVHKNLSAHELTERWVGFGVPKNYGDMLSAMDTDIKNGSEDRTNSVVLALTGKQPRRFREFALESKDAWATRV